MTSRFKTGDHIRVRHVPGSPWQDAHGTILNVIVRPENESVQECAVSFGGEQRWFMAEHLVKVVHPNLIRFFRNEVLDRWNLDPDKTAVLNGDRDQLVEFLRDQYDFPVRRAEAEVEDFYEVFQKKTQPAAEVLPPLTKSHTAA